MRTVLEKRSLSKALAVLNKVVDKRSVLPQLTWLKVASINGYSQFQATDLEKYLTVRVQSITEEAGEVCVAMKEFAKLVKGREKEIRLWTEEDKLVVQAGGLKGMLSLGSVESFPDFPVSTYEAVFPVRLLRFAIEKVGFVLPSKDSDMDYLRYVLMDGEGKSVNFVASDGYRLAYLRADVPFDMRLKFPQKGLKVLLDLLKRKKGESVKVGKSEDFVFIEGTDWELALRVLEWDYPDYKAVFPQKFKTRVLVDIKELDRALESFSSLEMVVFHIGEGLTLRAEWTEYELPAKVEGEGLVIAFNPKFIKQFTEINEGNVEMLLIDEENPALFKLGEGYFYLVMPMRMR